MMELDNTEERKLLENDPYFGSEKHSLIRKPSGSFTQTTVVNGFTDSNTSYFNENFQDNQRSSSFKSDCIVQNFSPQVRYCHLYPNVIINSSHEVSDIDSDEEDFQLRHRKNDSGNGSSVGSSSINSHVNECCNSFDVCSKSSESAVECCAEDSIDLFTESPIITPRTTTFTVRSFNSELRRFSGNSFMDVPLNNTFNEKLNLNTFAPRRANEDENVLAADYLKAPSVTDIQPKTKFLSKPTSKSWQIFGKVAVAITKDLSPKSSPNICKNRKETIGSSTTALILENRPSHLPPKSAKEEQKHREQYAEMIAAAKRKELRDSHVEKKKIKERRKLEDHLFNAVKQWKEEIIPNWGKCYKTKKVRELWFQGVPPSVRGIIWKLAIGNKLNITSDLFEVFLSNAEAKVRNHCFNEPIAAVCHNSESSVVVSKENTIALIALDVSRTFPSLCIFQKGGPYHDPLKNLLAAYTCHRPDIGYVQGMSFLAAMLLLNMDLCDAFIAFSNLLNRTCQMAFFTVNQPKMDAYFRTFDVLLADQIPRLHSHFKQESLSHDIYLLDWIFTLFSKSLPLDTACRVWDIFCRDGEEFLFKTALGILLMHEDALLEMEFFRLATYLTKLSSSITAEQLFTYIEKINFPIQKYKTTLNQMMVAANACTS